jgi:hypothetical protein
MEKEVVVEGPEFISVKRNCRNRFSSTIRNSFTRWMKGFGLGSFMRVEIKMAPTCFQVGAPGSVDVTVLKISLSGS